MTMIWTRRGGGGSLLMLWALLFPAVRMQLLAVRSEAKSACDTELTFPCANGQCVPKSWRCDGYGDCLDKSDEVGCGCEAFHVACADGAGCVRGDDVCDGVRDCVDGSDEEALCADACANSDTALFRCVAGGECVAARRRCDGVAQCGDGSDERGCGSPSSSSGGVAGSCALRCDSGDTCVHEERLCDGAADCRDGADEAACGGPETPLRAASLGPRGPCGVADFPCSSGECVPEMQRCDGQDDCRDASDEGDCSSAALLTPRPSKCGRGKRRCSAAGPQCVPLVWWCDGKTDCEDGSDEEECGEVWRACRPTEWLCENGRRCVPLSWRCDGEADCPDHSDERLCDASVGLGPDWCRLSEFPCTDGGCAPWAAACNGSQQCADGSDEGEACGAAAAACADLGCSHRCHATPVGPVCVCPAGFRLGESGRGCVDRDECKELAVPPCAQHCLNSVGAFGCACAAGYQRAPSGACRAPEPEAMLAYASMGVVSAVALTTDHQVVLAELARSVVSLDFDGASGRVYWYERQDRRIAWALINGTHNGTLYADVAAEAIAVDWVARNIYWTDSETNCIMAAQLEDRSESEVAARVVIVGSEVEEPHSLALQATDGLLYWSEWGEAPRISRANMDGSGRKVLLSDGLGWPDGLALDLPSSRLYWIDARLDSIESCGLDGARRMVVTTADVRGPFSLAVFEDALYWSSLGARKLETANKRTGRGRKTLFRHKHEIHALKMIHPLLQPEHPNPCSRERCSHRCVLGAGAGATCACPRGARLGSDSATCQPTGALPYLLLVSPTAITQVFMESQEDEAVGAPHMQGLRSAPSLSGVARVAYSRADHKLFYASEEATASGRAHVVQLHGGSSDPALQLLVMVQAVRDVAVDWSGENLYWLSAGRPTIEATPLDSLNERAVVVLAGGLERPVSLALDPSSGDMCVSEWGRARSGAGARIECARMDGTERRIVIAFEGAARPDSLVIDANRSLLLWADEELGTIQSVKLDGSDHQILHRGVHHVAGLAVVDSALFWVVNKERSSELWRDGGDLAWVALRERVLDVAAARALLPTDGLACRGRGCEHACLVVRRGEEACACPPGLAVEGPNGTACGPPRSCEAPARRRCRDGGCVPAALWCDAVRDCDDGSDEERCLQPVEETTPQLTRAFEPELLQSVDTWAAPTVRPDTTAGDNKPALPTAIAAPSTAAPPQAAAAQPATAAAPRDSEATSRVDTPFVMPSCSDAYCSGRGSCEEEDDGLPVCTCSWGYRGPNCQFFVIQALGVKAAVGCATVIGVAVIAVAVAVVLNKRRRRLLERDVPEEEVTVTFTAAPDESPAQEMSLVRPRRSESPSPSASGQGQDSTEVV